MEQHHDMSQPRCGLTIRNRLHWVWNWRSGAESRSKAQGKKLLRLRSPRRERLQYVPTLWQCIYLKRWNNRQRQDDAGLYTMSYPRRRSSRPYRRWLTSTRFVRMAIAWQSHPRTAPIAPAQTAQFAIVKSS